jgi:chromosome segregation ATPase
MDPVVTQWLMNNFGPVSVIAILALMRYLDSRAVNKQMKKADASNQEVIDSMEKKITEVTDSFSKLHVAMQDALSKHMEVEEARYTSIDKNQQKMLENQKQQSDLMGELKRFEQAIDNNTAAMQGLSDTLGQQQLLYKELKFIMEHHTRKLDQIHEKVS